MIDFFKMEGAGNDYIYIDLRNAPQLISRMNTRVLPLLCDRRYGIGGDGLVLIGPSEQASGRMWMWNADGSSSSMCGNALRCVSLYLSSDLQEDNLLVESGVGLHRAEIIERQEPLTGKVRLDMGRPVFDRAAIPFKAGDQQEAQEAQEAQEPQRFAHGLPDLDEGYVLSMGNPHCVIFVEDADELPIEKTGPTLEHHRAFPERTNVEYVSLREDGSLYQRTWERGSGETMACGSGACAALVAAASSGRSPRRNIVHLRGGDLLIEWNDTVMMTGPARLVFRGQVNEREFDLFG